MHPCQSLEIGCADAELGESARTSSGCGELHVSAGVSERLRWDFDQKNRKIAKQLLYITVQTCTNCLLFSFLFHILMGKTSKHACVTCLHQMNGCFISTSRCMAASFEGFAWDAHGNAPSWCHSVERSACWLCHWSLALGLDPVAEATAVWSESLCGGVEYCNGWSCKKWTLGCRLISVAIVAILRSNWWCAAGHLHACLSCWTSMAIGLVVTSPGACGCCSVQCCHQYVRRCWSMATCIETLGTGPWWNPGGYNQLQCGDYWLWSGSGLATSPAHFSLVRWLEGCYKFLGIIGIVFFG